MKKFKKENQYTDGKKNYEADRKPRQDKTSDSINGRGLFRNGTEPNDNEDRDILGNNDYRLRANRPGNGQSGQSKKQKETNRNNKMDLVKDEIQNRSRGKYESGKTGNRWDERRNEDRAGN